MKTVFKVLTICLLVVVASCKNETPEVKTIETEEVALVTSTENPYKDYAKVEFNIEGMTCAMGCAKTIEKKIAKLDGVHFVNVDFDKKLAMVEFDSEKLSSDDFTKTVNNVSDVYKVENITTVDGFTKDKKACAKDCKKECCKDKTEAEKMSCKKACCVKTV
jgi:Cu+-exporting ATPase